MDSFVKKRIADLGYTGKAKESAEKYLTTMMMYLNGLMSMQRATYELENIDRHYWPARTGYQTV
jgi:hypothetical protein